jgi:hypothetical protein
MEKISSPFLGPSKQTAVVVHRHFNRHFSRHSHRHLGHLPLIFLDPVPAHQFPVQDQKMACWAEETQEGP